MKRGIYSFAAEAGGTEGKQKKRIRPEFVIVVLLLLTVAVCGGAAVIGGLSSPDPLCETIEEDDCFRDGVFYIYNKKDYVRFIGYVNRAYQTEGSVSIDAVLMADIDLEKDKGYGYSLADHPYIKSPMLRYGGTFDGNGHSIRWFTDASYGMFVRLERDAQIRNLTIEAGHICDGTDPQDNVMENTGYGFGILCMANYGFIQNCQTGGYIEGCGDTGGIAGINYGQIEDCINQARVVSVGVGMYGGGGIAGKNADTWTEADGEEQVKAVICTCTNQGTVTGEWMAGGICGFNEGTDTEIRRCGNEGAVSVRRQEALPCQNSGDETMQGRLEEARAGGIAGNMDCGTFTECYNIGRISIEEEGLCGTYGIAGGAWGNAKVVNCVSLAGTATGHMRHENIMELTQEEMEQWRADPDSIPYVYNSWQFDLEEAKEKLGIVPLGVSESELTEGNPHVYLCEEFCMRAPMGFAIREVSEYALCMEAEEGTKIPEWFGEGAEEYQVWLLRLPEEEAEEMNRFLEEVKDLYSIYEPAAYFNDKDSLEGALWLASLDDEEEESDISRIWACMEEPNWVRPLYFMNWWDHHTYQADCRYFFNLYKEELNAKHYVFVPGDESQRLRLDNLLSMPVKSSEEGEEIRYEVKYLMLFTNWANNYRPEMAFTENTLRGFVYLPYQKEVWQKYETLFHIAEEYTGDGMRYPELAACNGLENPDLIRKGQKLTVPEEWLISEWLLYHDVALYR